ncbi:MAG TPA: methylated-DNA--[protein]-cysteine S-methyltransferase [Paludibacteraceae bacterium]|nr:methylated-DNA--[protein]-cysteine S-methyltransferase [Paludibacteraceae bacterium]
MPEQQQIDFERIATAIEYMYTNFRTQPSLDEVAAHVSMSPFHFQRMFQQWAGVSPKKFMQYLNVSHAGNLLRSNQLSLFDAASETGLSGTGRLYDLFVKIEGMTPGEYKNGGRNLNICYCFSPTRFGEMLVASSGKGICYLAFSEDKDRMLTELNELFPNAAYSEQTDELIKKVIRFFGLNWNNPEEIKLHLKGTPFQLKVWETLLKIPEGRLATYGEIAEKINNPKATRAVGSAVGDNPVSFLIPCHRVIRSSGVLGQYHWGPSRKKAMIGWEAVRKD